MKPSARTLVAAMTITAGGAFAQAGMDDMKVMQTAKVASPDKHSLHKATGTVKKADTEAGVVTLAHGPVPTLNWPAMTMGFKVRDKRMWSKLREGSEVQVEFTKKGEDYVIEKVK